MPNNSDPVRIRPSTIPRFANSMVREWLRYLGPLGTPSGARISPVHTWARVPFSRRDALASLALGLMVAAVYFPALWGDFVWDDVILVEEPAVRKGTGLWSIWFQPWTMDRENHYWPVVYTSFWLEHKIWGFAPLGYHLVNALLHLVNSVLVWRLLLRLAVPAAWTVAALFAVHPLHVESVAWIIERKDLLSALFYLTAVVAWIRFVEAPGRGRYLLALALFTAGLLSKSVVVTLPAALLIWHCWKRDGVTLVDVRRLVPFFAVGLCITMGGLPALRLACAAFLGLLDGGAIADRGTRLVVLYGQAPMARGLGGDLSRSGKSAPGIRWPGPMSSPRPRWRRCSGSAGGGAVPDLWPERSSTR